MRYLARMAWWAGIAGGAAASLLSVACGAKTPPPAPPAVVIATTVRSASATASDEMRYAVEVLARYSNAMSFRVAGKLIERKVRLGDRVRKGEVIARLDAIDAQKQASSAHAALTAAEHRLLFAKQQLDRDTAQSTQDLIAANQLEQSQDAYAAALAARDQASAQLTLARNTLDYNALVADHDGVVTSENADTGAVVTAGQTIYGLAWSGDTDVVLDAAAIDLGGIRVGQAADVTFTALPEHHFNARVREISPAADPQSRTYRVKLTLLDPGTAVHLGMTGDATLAPQAMPERAQAVQIPAAALFHEGNRTAVWVIKHEDATLELRAVTVHRYGDRTITVTSGVQPGESIVAAGVHNVFAGQHVKPSTPLYASDDAEPPAFAAAAQGAAAQ